VAGVALGFTLGGWGPGSSAQQKAVMQVLYLDVEHLPRVDEERYDANALASISTVQVPANTDQ
jgi:hypothetical protein